MATSADVLICGGAVVGSAVAYFLTASGHEGRIVVVEPEPGYARAATMLSVGGIRQQFSNPLNIAMSAFGREVIGGFAARTGIDLHFREHGYLTLAATKAQASVLRASHAVQQAAGADIALLDPSGLAARFPHLAVENLELGAFGRRGEGWFDNAGLLRGFRELALRGGAVFLRDAVTGLDVAQGRVRGARLASGASIACGAFVNAAGGQGAEVAAMAGLALPVERRKRSVVVFDVAEPPVGDLPLMIAPNGVWCRPEGARFIAGCTPEPDPEVAADDFEPRHAEWEEVIWPTLASLATCFERARPCGYWAGHYDVNLLDRNAIVGPHPEIANFHFANGFSGHGLQQAAAIGRGLAELIVFGAYRSLDLAPFGYARVLARRPFLEALVI